MRALIVLCVIVGVGCFAYSFATYEAGQADSIGGYAAYAGAAFGYAAFALWVSLGQSSPALRKWLAFNACFVVYMGMWVLFGVGLLTPPFSLVIVVGAGATGVLGWSAALELA